MLYKKTIESPLGKITLVASDKAITAVSFGSANELNSSFKDSTESKNHSVLVRCEKELKEYFNGKRLTFSVPLAPSGTDFQKQVWKALSRIPYGKTISYSKQAESIGKRSGVRAVAAANGRNPIAIIVPCHRVIAKTNHLHGYAGGLHIKRKLLEIEGLKIKNLILEGENNL